MVARNYPLSLQIRKQKIHKYTNTHSGGQRAKSCRSIHLQETTRGFRRPNRGKELCDLRCEEKVSAVESTRTTYKQTEFVKRHGVKEVPGIGEANDSSDQLHRES